MSKTGRPTSNQGGVNGMVAGWTPHPVFSCQAPHQVHTWDFITANMSALLEKLRLSVSLFVSSCFFCFCNFKCPHKHSRNPRWTKTEEINMNWTFITLRPSNFAQFTNNLLTDLAHLQQTFFFTFLQRASQYFCFGLWYHIPHCHHGHLSKR